MYLYLIKMIFDQVCANGDFARSSLLRHKIYNFHSLEFVHEFFEIAISCLGHLNTITLKYRHYNEIFITCDAFYDLVNQVL